MLVVTHDWRNTMNLLSPAKMLGHGLVLISAVLLFHPDNALAAESAVDAQMQARDLLSGTVGGRAKTVDESPANPADGHQASSLDPQEQARQLILGKPKGDDSNGRAAALEPKMNTAPAVSTRRTGTYEDPQESARRMILGHGASAAAASASERSVSLTQEPLVMRLNKDEFRIAFGLNAGRFASNGCDGAVSYRVDWKTEDGTTRQEAKQVNYTVLPGASRTITVDHQYFDTAEAAHTTDVVKVSVDKITCVDSRPVQTAATAERRTMSPGSSF
jgi:hypothetical protein